MYLRSHQPLTSTKTSLQDYSAYDLPSVEVMVQYFHAAAGFPVLDTWLKAVKERNSVSWPGLAYHNKAKYYPIPDETLKLHMVHLRQGFHSTNPKPYQAICNMIPKSSDIPSDTTPSNELQIRV